jgi:hypothetical protein
MDWKSQLISTTAEAEAFIAAGLANAGLPPYHFQNRSAQKVDDVFFEAVAAEAVGKTRLHTDELFFSLHGCRETASQAVFKDIYVHRDFRYNGARRGVNLGTRGIKSFFGCDCVSGISVTIGEGDSLWPYLGAMPLEEPGDMPEVVNCELELFSERLTADDRAVLTVVRQRAERDPLQAWITLGRAYPRLSDQGKLARRRAINRLVAQQQLFDLYLFPSEGCPRAFLEETLGVLPPFRPFEGAGRHAAACAAVMAYTI